MPSWSRIPDDISFNLQSLPGPFFSHVMVSPNVAANELVRLDLFSRFDLSWSGVVPSKIRRFVASHCIQ